MTKDKRTFLILIALLLTICSTAQTTTVSYDRNRKYTVDELRFDFAILKDALLKTHPGLFWYQTEKEFEDNYNKVKNSINAPMTEMEFYTLIRPIMGNIKCGHTDIALSEAFVGYSISTLKVFPFYAKIVESKIYMEKNYTSDTTILIGSQIVSINGISSDSILHWMQPYQWTDGFAKSYTKMELGFRVLLLSLFNYPEKYTVNVIDAKGNTKLIQCEGIDAKTLAERRSVRYPNISNTPFTFRLIDSLSTAIIKISNFNGEGYEKFLENSFKTIKTKGTKNLIIDLKNNNGGDGSYANLLYSYIALKDYKYYTHLEITVDNKNDSIFKYGVLPEDIWGYKPVETEKGKYNLTKLPKEVLSKAPYKPHKNNFTGNVFVLINDKSFSASAEFSAITYYNKRAKFIGRETGGGYCGNTSGAVFLLTLPNTKIRGEWGLFKFCMAVDGPCGNGIKPDYPLNENINDLIFNKDSDLLFTLDLINRTK